MQFQYFTMLNPHSKYLLGQIEVVSKTTPEETAKRLEYIYAKRYFKGISFYPVAGICPIECHVRKNSRLPFTQ